MSLYNSRMKIAFLSPETLPRLLWGLAMLTLPVTSFRWFPGLGESALVRPLALYPLAFLLPLLLVLAWRKKTSLVWAGAFTALGAFVLFTLFSASLGALINPIPLRGQTYDGRAFRALITLFIGIAFFIGAVWMNKGEADLRFTVKWIFAGLCLNLAWSGLQAVTFYTGLLDKEMVTHWQLAFSMRELVRTNRISGLTYEPAWLAGQLATIYIPLLFAALLTKYRITPVRWLEPALLGLSTLVLLATYSRGGLLIAVGTSALMMLLFGRGMWAWFMRGFTERRFTPFIFRLSILIAIAGVIAGAFIFLSQKNYFRRLWEINAESLNEYIVDINAGARGAYSVGAMGAFSEYPLTGVGLGGSGFYIYRNLPDWSLTTVPEIAKQLNPASRLYPNPKNLYVRLLAETGLVGFVLFVAFQFNLLGETLSLLNRKEDWARFAAIAGVFAWLAVALYNLTQDSLTTPNIWIVPGILVGLATHQSNKEVQ
ncbi:MAG: O-antigen ligase family protein [Chloroflexi bacterium]|nr:O-antigen ligase family protein [Chloroflexota bacterium]